MARSDLAMPDGLDEHGALAWRTILAHLGVHTDCANDAGLAAACGCTKKVYTGGCRAFYSPAEWRERRERFGLESALVVVYEGSDLRQHMSLDGYDYPAVDAMQEALRSVGLYAEEGTIWYGAVYLTDTEWDWPAHMRRKDAGDADGWKEVP